MHRAVVLLTQVISGVLIYCLSCRWLRLPEFLDGWYVFQSRIIALEERLTLKNDPFESSYYTPEELSTIGLAETGEDVLIDRSVRLYRPGRIYIGSHVRIDAYSVLSASPEGLHIGNYVHLAVGVTLLGNARIDIEDFCGLSARVSIFSSNDDYSGGWLTNPTIPDRFRRVTSAPVMLRRHAILGAGTVVLPGVTIGMGASVGALSLVNKSVPDFMVVTGNPVRKVSFRDRSILSRETEFLATQEENKR